MNRAKRPFSVTALLASFGVAAVVQSALAANSFLGVAAGDASSTDVVLWTRCVDTNAPATVSLTAQVSTDPAFGTHTDFALSTDTNKDYTAKVVASPLTPATKYYYRFTDGSLTSLVGTFKTAPDTNAAVPVSFAFSGDCDGLIRPYALASQIPGKNLDFFMFDGDTIYETSSSIGSPAVTATGVTPAPSSTGASSNQLVADFSRKYRQQFAPVNAGGQNCLQSFFAGQGNYTAYDNHELGNLQYINGGAPAGGAVGDFTSGAGVDARQATNDTNLSGPFMNKAGGFQTLQQLYMNYQPVKERGFLNTPSDPRMNGTRQLYFAQQWGKNLMFINLDDRTYRDIRMKTSGNADDGSSPRADNTNRTMLGVTQVAWFEQTLLAAEQAGIPWKFVNISDPIDQIGPIGGALALSNAPSTAEYGTLGTITNITTTGSTSNSKNITVASCVGLAVGQSVSGTGIASGSKIASISTDGVTFALTTTNTVANGTSLTLQPAASTYAAVSSDGGKSWVGNYRAERNAILKFIADNHIRNVVFMATDDHQNRINELTYSTNGATGNQSTYAKVPYCFEVVCGPLGATGPDFIQNHTFALQKKLADSIYNAQVAAGLEPIGLMGYPGLQNLTRIGDANAAASPQAVDFYSPDTYNYNKFDISADGTLLTVASYGINSTIQNSFAEYDSTNNPEQVVFSFQIKAAIPFTYPESVASGDPTTNSVILWTRAVPTVATTNDLPISVVVSDSPAMTNIVFQRTNLLSRYAFDNCVKVMATNLNPYTTYYYQFYGTDTNNASPVGRTKTAPAPGQSVNARFAVLNCQDYIGRYYNTLAHLVLNESNKCDFVAYIGDYIYETTGDPSFQATNGPRSITFNDLAGARQLGTSNAPFYAAASLDNYRQLYHTYTSDPNLLKVRQLFPMIVMWDDHEYANDAWGATSTDYNGKTNEFNPQRRRNAQQAFYEHMPIAVGLDSQGVQIDSSILYPTTQIYHNFQYGSLLDIYLTDYRSFHPAELVPMDAFPGTVAMDEPTCNFVVGAGWTSVRGSFDPYVNIDDSTNAVLKATLQAVATGAYQAEGLAQGAAQTRAVGAVTGNLSATYINGLMQGAGLSAPFSTNQMAGMTRGLSFVLMGKTELFGSSGARYLVARQPYQLYAGYQNFLNPTLQNAWGATQTSDLVSNLTASTARWKLVENSTSFVPCGFDFANPPVPLPTNFPSSLRAQLQISADDWDGLPNGSQANLTLLASLGAVVFSGDIHAGFVMNHTTTSGVVPEFTSPSVSSSVFKDELAADASANPLIGGLPGLSNLIAASDILLKDQVTKTGLGTLLETHTDANGYLVLQATPQNLQAEFHTIPSSQVTNDLSTNATALNALASVYRWQVANTGAGLATYSVPSLSIKSSSTNLTLIGSTGTPGGTYNVLSTTNVNTPLNLWTTNASGSFDANGNFTVPVTGNTNTQKYFVIKQP